MSNTFYHLPQQLMASGLERLMKCYITLVYDGKHGSYPSNTYMKSLSHDLKRLLDRICTHYYGVAARPFVQRELDFINTDPILQDCIRILSQFGQKGRYYNLDVVTGVTNPPIDPKEEWEALEFSVEDVTPLLGNLERLHREYYPRVNSRLIGRTERLVRAIAMQFTLGEHEDRNGRLSQLSSIYTKFRNLRDDELGTTDYRRSVHILRQRDQDNWFRRSEQAIVSGEWPARIVTRNQFEGEWPFRADRVVVERRNELFYVVNVGGFDFALNGAAQSRYGMPEPHSAGVAILGKSVAPFIELASSLA